MPIPERSRHERFGFSDAESLKRTISELGLDIPFSDSIEILLSPIEIADRKAPNRLAIHPMEGADAERDGAPSALTFRRYRRFGAGGSGLIWFEAAAVTRQGLSNPRQLRLCASNVDAFERLVRQTRDAARERMGGGHDPLLVLQLTHSGRYAKPDGFPAPVIAQRNPPLEEGASGLSDDCIIKDEALDAMQEDFVESATLAARAGFDGVDIKACHGYLASELLSARDRKDSRYGGALENRTRFLLETIERIQRRLPGLIVTSRITAYDGLPYPYGFGTSEKNAGALNLTEPGKLVARLEKAGLPLLNVSIGIPYKNPHMGRPFNRPCIHDALPGEHPLVGVDRLLGITAKLQQTFSGLPMVGTGYSWLKQFFPHVGAAVIERGRAAFIGQGRGAFAYPDFAFDLMRRGALDPKKLCVACSCCSELIRRKESAGCVVRDKEIYAPLYKKCTAAE